MSRLFFLAALVVALAGYSTSAQDGLLKQQEKLQSVALQKVEIGIREAISDAQRLQAAGSNARAAERVRAALRMLDDPILPKKNVDAWRVQLNAALTAAERGQKPVVADLEKPGRDAEIARVKAMIAEDQEIRRSVDTVASLMKANDTVQAKKEVEALSKKFPTNATVAVLPNLVAKTMTLDDIKEVHAKQMENIRLTLIDLQKTATMAKIDYELPSDWKEKTERRKPQLSPKLKAVLTALKEPVEIDKANAPLSDVLKTLSTLMKQPIILDKATMTEAGVDQSTQTTVQPGTSVSAKTALRLALNNHGLTYVIKDNTIHVVTREKAISMMETRVYYIGDLVTPISSGFVGVPGRASAPITADVDQERKNVENLIKQIKESYDPNSWKGGGSDGKGDVTYHPASKALIVKASAEVHGMMGNSMNR